MIDLIEAGHSYKVHGIKGEMVIDFLPQYQGHILKSGVVFFKVDGNAVPFFIESIRGDETMFIKFREVDNPEQARDISNKVVYIDAQRLPPSPKNKMTTISSQGKHSLIDFVITDLQSGSSGVITGIEEYPSQLMAQIEYNQKQILIPLHEDWIVKINKKQNTITVKLPEGIWNLNEAEE